MNEQVAATHAESSLSGIQLAKRSIRAAGNLALAPREDREALSLMPHQRLLPSAEAPLRKERGRKAKLTPTISKALLGRGTYPPNIGAVRGKRSHPRLQCQLLRNSWRASTLRV